MSAFSGTPIARAGIVPRRSVPQQRSGGGLVHLLQSEHLRLLRCDDVAAAAGGSPSTVSRTCKDSPSISRDTKERVRRIMAQLTTVDVNPYQLGMEAASQTINHIENPNLLATKIIVPHRLIPRESCCPPPEV